jgi:hypothetical protein
MLRDSYALGLAAGLAFAASAYWLWIRYEAVAGWLGPAAGALKPPGIQLVLLGLAMILFRFMLLRWNRARAARALLAVLFASVIIAGFKFRQQLL